MTTTRIVRGTKGRIFLYVCGVLILTGILACYNNARNQLEDVQKTNDLCRQQQEHLTSQLQVIFDYKQRLEKSLKTEKIEHEQLKNELENKNKEEHQEHEKAISENKLRFMSLQKQYKLLERQFDDLKEDSSKMQSKQTNEINQLQTKLNEMLKEKEKLQRQLKITQYDVEIKEKRLGKLSDELDALKKTRNGAVGQPNQGNSLRRANVRDVNFSKQKADGSEAYEIQTHDYRNKTNDTRKIDERTVATSPSSSSSTKGKSLEAVPLMPGLPSSTPESRLKNLTSKSSSNVLAVPNQKKPIPNGFVQYEERQQRPPHLQVVDDKTVLRMPDRYDNKIDGNDDDAAMNLANNFLKPEDVEEKENGANEIDPMNDKHEDLIDANIESLQHRIKLHIDNLQQPEDPEVEDAGNNEDDDDYMEKKDLAVRN